MVKPQKLKNLSATMYKNILLFYRMVKNDSRKIKKKGGRKYHIGGTPHDAIPDNSVTVTPKIVDYIPPPKTDLQNNTKQLEESTKPSELQFQFTRHVLSCNNANLGKGLFGKDFEPGATVYGIFKTIEYAQLPEQAPNFNFDHVYVSNLYRTWITAVLLYGTNLVEGSTLNLYISPFLKELHNEPLKKGNFPKDIYHMANKFLKFLEELHSYCILSNGNVEELYDEENRIKWYNNLPKRIILHLPPGINNEVIYQKNENNIYELKSFCNVEDAAGPNSGNDFTKTGDLQKFMDWYNKEDSNYYGINSQENKVHIVTHSHIMRNYLSNFNVTFEVEGKAPEAPVSFDIDVLNDEKLNEIRNSNSWHFITTARKKELLKSTAYSSIEKAVDDLKLLAGVPININKAKELENKNLKTSLCGIEGSVEPVPKTKTCNKGGRKTRKKRIRKTKKHSKRRNNKSSKHHK